MTPIEQRNEKLADYVVSAFRARHFDAYYTRTAEDAVSLALSLIPKTDTVSFGGSMTIRDIGLIDKLYENGYNIIDRDKEADKHEAARKSLLCDTFLMSANAISEDGQLVNIDGNGNRVAALIFGPKSVIVIAGMNKVVKTAEDAMQRARTIAAPINAQRFDVKTGCSESGKCTDCKSAQSICAHLVTTRICRPAGRIKVILVGENLGY